MCKAVEELAETWAERRAEERRIETKIDDVRNLMDTMKLSAEQAMDALRVSEEDRLIFIKRF